MHICRLLRPAKVNHTQSAGRFVSAGGVHHPRDRHPYGVAPLQIHAEARGHERVSTYMRGVSACLDADETNRHRLNPGINHDFDDKHGQHASVLQPNPPLQHRRRPPHHRAPGRLLLLWALVLALLAHQRAHAVLRVLHPRNALPALHRLHPLAPGPRCQPPLRQVRLCV